LVFFRLLLFGSGYRLFFSPCPCNRRQLPRTRLLPLSAGAASGAGRVAVFSCSCCGSYRAGGRLFATGSVHVRSYDRGCAFADSYISTRAYVWPVAGTSEHCCAAALGCLPPAAGTVPDARRVQACSCGSRGSYHLGCAGTQAIPSPRIAIVAGYTSLGIAMCTCPRPSGQRLASTGLAVPRRRVASPLAAGAVPVAKSVPTAWAVSWPPASLI